MKIFYTIVLVLIAYSSSFATTVRDMFLEDNQEYFNLIPKDVRMDMLDYYDAGRVVSATNALGNGSELIKVTNDFQIGRAHV